MGGPETIRRVMAECPTPIVVFAAAQTDQRLAWQALEYGAAEVFAKPTAGLDPVTVANLAAALRRAASARVGRRPATPRRRAPPTAAPPALAPPPDRGCWASSDRPARPQVLQRILSTLPANFPWPIAIVQHTLRGFTESLVSWLSGYTALRGRAGAGRAASCERGPGAGGARRRPPGDRRPRPGAADAPAPIVDGHRPSATVLLRSLAASYGAAGRRAWC